MVPGTLGPILLLAWTVGQTDSTYGRIPHLEYLFDCTVQPDVEKLRAILHEPFDGLPIVLFSPQVPCAAWDRIEARSVVVKRLPTVPNFNRMSRGSSPSPECKPPDLPPPVLQRKAWCDMPPVEPRPDRIDSTFKRTQRRATLEACANRSTVDASDGLRAPTTGNGARTEQPCQVASPF